MRRYGPTIVAWEPHLRSLLSARKMRGGLRRFGWMSTARCPPRGPGPTAADAPAAKPIGRPGPRDRHLGQPAAPPTSRRPGSWPWACWRPFPPGARPPSSPSTTSRASCMPRTADAEAVRQAMDALQTAGTLHRAPRRALRREPLPARRPRRPPSDPARHRRPRREERGRPGGRPGGGPGGADPRVLRRAWDAWTSASCGGSPSSPAATTSRRGRRSTPSAIAAGILQAPEVAAAAPSRRRRLPPLATSAPVAPPPPPPARPASSPLLWAGAGLVLLAVAGAIALLGHRAAASCPRHARAVRVVRPDPARHRHRRKPRAAPCSPAWTCRARGLEKTVLLREKPVLAVTAGRARGPALPPLARERDLDRPRPRQRHRARRRGGLQPALPHPARRRAASWSTTWTARTARG